MPIQLQLIQDQLSFSTTDRTVLNILLELLSLMDRDLTYVLDIVKRALQVSREAYMFGDFVCH